MDPNTALTNIIKKFDDSLSKNQAAQSIFGRIAEKTATYEDLDMLAQTEGQLLAHAIDAYAPEVLTDGILYRETAEQVVKSPMLRSIRGLNKAVDDVQTALNEEAGIGLGTIFPETNLDRIDGIITAAANAEYESIRASFLDRIQNALEGHVDDCAKSNADFHYRVGLNPKIIRRAESKCCEWCANLAGVYSYGELENTEVFRRHNNCHCRVIFDPSGSKGNWRRQDVHTKRYLD